MYVCVEGGVVLYICVGMCESACLHMSVCVYARVCIRATYK